MSKLVRSVNGSYFVQGSGFTGTVATATRFDTFDGAYTTRSCARNMGLGDSEIVEAPAAAPNPIVQNPDGTSWAPNYVRAKDANGGVKHNNLNPSPRRFRTRAEAEHHAARFMKIEGHVGFYVTLTNDPVNAWINPVNGKTNPEIGRMRTNR